MATCSDYIILMRLHLHPDIIVTCPDNILLKFAVVSAAAPLIIPSSAHAGKLCAMILCSKF